MKLNRVEKALMNNPLRATLQRFYELRAFERLGGRVDGLRALEIGCGRGAGVEMILESLGAASVDAFDLDPDMVERARRRLGRFPPERVRLWVGDATSIPSPDESYDAVFDFGVIHHVPEWRKAVAEVARVIEPGGSFYFDEITRQALDAWLARTLTDHPREDRFSGREFVEELARRNIAVGTNWEERFFGHFVIGVGRRLFAQDDRVRSG